jgi:hypothetical protein
MTTINNTNNTLFTKNSNSESIKQSVRQSIKQTNESIIQSDFQSKPKDDNDNFNKIVTLFLFLQNTMKLYHWNTENYPRHKASDEFLENFNSNVDKFVEVYIGRYNIKPKVSNIEIGQDINDTNIEDLLIKCRNKLEDFKYCITDTGLLNIRDEMLALINQTLYLFKLH